MFLGTSKLIYVGPDNHKIGDISEKLKKYDKWEAKGGVGEKRASRMFRLRKIYVFNTNFNMERSKKIIWGFFNKVWKSIQFGRLDQKTLLFIWFFIVDGQKAI